MKIVIVLEGDPFQVKYLKDRLKSYLMNKIVMGKLKVTMKFNRK